MTEHIIDGRATGRQQLLHMLRDVCHGAGALCEYQALTPGLWQDRAKPAIKSCAMLQRGLARSHPQLADGLHILATEIQIAIAAQDDNALFSTRVQRIRDAVKRVQQMGAEL